MEIEKAVSSEETHLKALDKVMEVLAAEKPRWLAILGAIVRIQRWVRRFRARRAGRAAAPGQPQEEALFHSLNTEGFPGLGPGPGSGSLDSTFERRQTTVEETREFLSSYGKNSTFSTLMATINSLLNDEEDKRQHDGPALHSPASPSLR